jgi:hypothetical protein
VGRMRVMWWGGVWSVMLVRMTLGATATWTRSWRSSNCWGRTSNWYRYVCRALFHNASFVVSNVARMGVVIVRVLREWGRVVKTLFSRS